MIIIGALALIPILTIYTAMSWGYVMYKFWA